VIAVDDRQKPGAVIVMLNNAVMLADGYAGAGLPVMAMKIIENIDDFGTRITID
jgi:hypothetical protein